MIEPYFFAETAADLRRACEKVENHLYYIQCVAKKPKQYSEHCAGVQKA